MTLHRFFVTPGAARHGKVTFPEAVSHQLRRVLRMRVGDDVLVLDGSGVEYLVKLADLESPVVGDILDTAPSSGETSRPIVLYQGMLKATKFETVIQHCTEAGVSRIVPCMTTRSIPTDLPVARFRRFEVIAREAAEQSGRGKVPEVVSPLPFDAAMRVAVDSGPVLLLYEDARDTHLLAADLEQHSGSVSIFVGPEGGFQPEEVTLAVRMGAQSISLGPRIFRAETAAIVGCALISARLDVART